MFHKEGAKIILISTTLFVVLLLVSPMVISNPWILKSNTNAIAFSDCIAIF